LDNYERGLQTKVGDTEAALPDFWDRDHRALSTARELGRGSRRHWSTDRDGGKDWRRELTLARTSYSAEADLAKYARIAAAG